MRAESDSSSSPSSTGTTRCSRIGPWSSSSSTRCTVAPVTLTPCSSACRCACRPAKRGQEGRMDVEDAPRESAHENGRDEPHESREADQIHLVRRGGGPRVRHRTLRARTNPGARGRRWERPRFARARVPGRPRRSKSRPPRAHRAFRRESHRGSPEGSSRGRK